MSPAVVTEVAYVPASAQDRVSPAAGVNASISDMAQWLLAQSPGP